VPNSIRLGTCKLIKEVMIGEDRLIHFSGPALGEACTIVLRGANENLLDEAERSMHDALCVLSQTVANKGVLLGGGNPEIAMAKRVDAVASRTAGKMAIAIEAFGRALRKIPTIICDNAGMDAADVITKLRAAIGKDANSRFGVDVMRGDMGDMAEMGVLESLKVKKQIVMSATEAAEMILRVDDIIKCAPRQRDGM
jgi:T-complex protein 1 subunit beta